MTSVQIQWDDYEELVKDIYETLGKAHGVTIECWGAKCRRTGKSGASYQFDVLTTHSDGVHQYRTAIECKYWNKKVDRRVINEHVQLVQEVQVDKGVVVSKLGFSSDAKKVATANNIGLVELRRPLDKDWEGKIKDIHIKLSIDQTEIYDFSFTILQRAGDDNTLQSGPLHCPILPNQITVETPNQEAESLKKLVDQERRKDSTGTEFEIQFPEGSTLIAPDYPDSLHGQRIGGVSFKVRYNPPLERNIVIRGQDHVYMIMDSIFDGRRYTISPEGEITENLPLDEGDY
ncbi:MAG: restriction endonuclease [Caldilineaceae bacterium SB0675_bin_29]|uniref:Restriction endonuclease n=1 Tax=Caldilineaceae bacterium SB0675_bin_29 TaxID=2605266 RepID=A0A6B1FVY6_9CHLR|nr:restriction endonuclease [Caldilineaceae bacterium SB0675_bin_29]